MKLLQTLGTGMFLVAVVGCNAARHPPRESGQVNAWLMHTTSDAASENAIVAQRTLYAHHFVADSAVLNELGEADLSVLAAHFKEHPGTMNVRRGDTPRELYDSRVKTVVEELAKAGVDTERISVEDALPGGDGMASESLVTILVPDSGESGAPTAGVRGATRAGMQGVTR